VRVSDFDYQLPDELIANLPTDRRDAARLFVYDRATGIRRHLHVFDLPELLEPGDLLVLNDTRVLPHRLVGQRATGGRVETLILSREGDVATGYLKPARKIRSGEAIILEEGAITLHPLEDLGGGRFRFRLEAKEGDLAASIERVGRAPLPPYIDRDGREDSGVDRERYQTVFAEVPGAVAAPTAGLHFTSELLMALESRGVVIGKATLHVGAATFAPVRVDHVEDHRMHGEEYSLSEDLADKVRTARASGRRVVAVGTTAVRTLETCALSDRTVAQGDGETDIFLHPGRAPVVVDAMLTNFHLPESTLLMLVAAFVGRETILDLYGEAIERRYRFYSFGDAMLIL
jgi:S-adenosylmethionine:tRNA ribosyltransferase-isomerase